MSDTLVDLDRLESVVRRQSRRELDGVRSAALARFRSTGLPTTRHEDWKYTNLTPVARISNDWLAGADSADAETPKTLEVPVQIDAVWLEIRNGRIDDASLEAANRALEGQAVIGRLSASSGGAELYMGDPVSSLNAALMDDAICISVMRNANVARPIGLLLADETGKNAGVSQVRLVISVDHHGSAEFIEAHKSGGEGDHYASIVTEMALADSASARYVKVQERARHHLQVGRLQARIGKDASLDYASVDLGGRMIRNDISATLTAPGGHFGSTGLYLAEDGQHIDNHISADHEVGPATSNQNYRGIANGRSRCVYNGKAIVREGADGTDAKQSNHNLLLSEKAEIDTKPELEIYAEDVKCAHGATVGQLDKSALFYLRSRGLDRDQAAQILTRAFASSILADIPVEAAREYIDLATDAKLDRLVWEAKS